MSRINRGWSRPPLLRSCRQAAHVALVLLIARGAGAQTDRRVDLTEMTLDQLLRIEVIAATKTQVPQIEVPQAITVLTRSDIRRIPAQNLGDLLRSAVGANVVRVQTSQNVLGTRGSNAFAPSQLLILINGQPISPTLFSTTWWDLVPISIGEIERIEFIRSPGTIYGANAQHGVVNIITQATDDGSDRAVSVTSEMGQQNLQHHYVRYRHVDGEKVYHLSAETKSLDAYQHPVSLTIVPGRASAYGEQTFNTHRQQLALQNVFGSTRTPLFGHPLTTSVGVKHISNAQGRVPDRLCFVGIHGSIGFANARYVVEGDRTTQTVTLAADLADYTFVRNADPSVPVAPAAVAAAPAAIDRVDLRGSRPDPAGFDATSVCEGLKAGTAAAATAGAPAAAAPAVSDPNVLNPASTRLTTLGGGYEVQHAIGAAQQLLVGAHYTIETGSNRRGTPFYTDARVERSPSGTAFVQDAIRLSEAGRLYVGGLFSDHYIAGAHIAPMIAYVHKLSEDYVVRVGSFTSYRNPNVFESSMDYDQVTGAAAKRTRLVSNRQLEAERTVSYEAGVRTHLTRRLLVSADVYRNNVSNGIEWQLVGVDTAGGARPRYRSANTLRQRSHGVELDVKYEMARWLSVGSNAATTTVSNRSSDPVYQGVGGNGANGIGQGRYGADYVPPHIANTTLTLTPPRTQIWLHYQTVGAHTWQWPSWSSQTRADTFALKPVPAYHTLNATASVQLRAGVLLGVGSQNLFNTLHTEWRGDESYFGRSVWAKVQLRFGSIGRDQ